MSEFNIKYMEKALELAREAFQDDEVPVGAVIVRNGEIVATGRNRREKEKNALLHAETDAINNACKALGGWRLWNCDIYVTLEPCPMCAGAIINAHIPNVYFGNSKNYCKKQDYPQQYIQPEQGKTSSEFSLSF